MNFFNELKRRNVVRVAVAYLVVGWLVLQVGQAIFPTFGAPEWVLKVFIALIGLGFPLALLLSWAYEMTPEGVKKTEEVDANTSITRSTGQKLNYVIIAALVAALGYVAFDKYLTVGEVEIAPADVAGAEKSIAVLPFVNMSGEAANEYFSDGISEEILNVLAHVEGLSVASRTSSFLYKGRERNIPEIAGELQVDHILEGSVRKAGNKVRITAQLIEAATDRHLWSETYDRELTDIFAIQDEIANAIVAALKGALGAGETRPIVVPVATRDMDAYDLYLKARSLFLARDPLGLRQSIELFEAAVARDPAFARAWEGLAAVYSVVFEYPTPEGYEPVPIEFAKLKADETANRALALDPALSLPHAVLGQFYGRENRWSDAVAEHEKAVELDPQDTTALLWYGILLLDAGYSDRALEKLQRAYDLDPDVGIFNDYLSLALAQVGRFEDSLQYGLPALAKGRDFAGIYLITSYVGLGRDDEAVLAAYAALNYLKGPAFAQKIAIANKWVELLKYKRDSALTQSGSRADAPLPGPLADPDLDFAGSDFEADAYLAIQNLKGEFGLMVERLETERPELQFVWLPEFADFRKSQEFKEYARARGLVEFWRTYGWPGYCHPLGEDDFECE